MKLGKFEHLTGDKVSDLTFSEFSQRWLLEYCQLEKAETQWGEDKRVVTIHLDPALGKIKLSALKKSDLTDLKLKLLKGVKPGLRKLSYAPKTINNIMGLAKKIMNTAVEWEVVGRNPFQEVKNIKAKEQDFDFWKPEERDQFLSQCYRVDGDFADAVLVACHTGLRLGEMAGLTWSAIDFDRKMLSVRDTFNYKLNKRFQRTKTHDKSVLLPMNALVCATLRRRKLANGGEEVFPNSLLKWSCKRLQRLSRKFSVREIWFHDLRHTFASCLAMAGVDLMVIKELMRHKSYQMTLRYAHLHPDHLRGATEVLASRGQVFAHDQNGDFLPCPRTAHETENRKVLQFSARR